MLVAYEGANAFVVNGVVDNECVGVYPWLNRVELGQIMKSSTGRWVSGGDFFDREAELDVLGTRVREGNHVLLSG